MLLPDPASQESPWREYAQVQEVFSETQKEVDERKFIAGRWWMPYHIGRETWCVGLMDGMH